MKILLVGGNFSGRTNFTQGRPSGVIRKLGEVFKEWELVIEVVNGGTLYELENIDIEPYDLVMWMANVDNKEPKKYPQKAKGSVLVISKLITGDRTEMDAVARIFGMKANAVVGIRYSPEGPGDNGKHRFKFKLMDALGNLWAETEDVKELADGILAFNHWTTGSKRVGTSRFYNDDLAEVVELNKVVADKFEKVKSRYFGNVSTRCMKMSPTKRAKNNTVFVSRRNVSKQRLMVDDMVLAFYDESQNIKYVGDHKPSVDTPIQLAVYEQVPQVNYMIHGHAYVQYARFTTHYFTCGDMGEVDEVVSLMLDERKRHGVINLRNHGFLIYADTLENLRYEVNRAELTQREIGFERVQDPDSVVEPEPMICGRNGCQNRAGSGICPYDDEISNEQNECNCCESCRTDCAMDI
jgi:hypothetical protein